VRIQITGACLPEKNHRDKQKTLERVIKSDYLALLIKFGKAMKDRRSTSKSQCLAAAITVLAAAVMLAPLRSGPQPTRTQNASFIPLLDAQGVAESAAFRRLSNVRPLEALAEPQVKLPTLSGPRRD
jgi:hypothetical protein